MLERPWDNPASRVTGELTALVGACVMGEHRHRGALNWQTWQTCFLFVFSVQFDREKPQAARL
jgi:hypothetical protein